MLGEAYFLDGQLDRARAAASQALGVCTEVGYLLGIGWSNQVLGRVAQAQGALAEAQRHLDDALRCFVSVDARFEMGRTHLFAADLAQVRIQRAAAASHLEQARNLFAALGVPHYAERADKLSGTA